MLFLLLISSVVVAFESIRSFPPPPQGLKSFLHISDVHYDEYYETGTAANCERHVFMNYPCCHAGDDPVHGILRPAGLFGDGNCDSPRYLLQTLFDLLGNDSNVPGDFVVWTGDDPNHADVSQSEQSNIAAVQLVTNYVKQIAKKRPVIAALGNHEAFPVDQLGVYPANQWLLKPIWKLWVQWLPTKDARATFAHGGWYTYSPAKGWRIISLQTTYFDTHNSFVSSLFDPMDQLKWFNETLQRARAARESCWVVGHIAPSMPEATAYFAQHYLSLVADYADVVKVQLFAHSHFAQFFLTWPNSVQFDNKTGPPLSAAPSGFILAVPSITPFNPGGVNPSARMVYYNETTLKIVDFVTYSMNLSMANEELKPNFGLIQSRASEFLGAPVSPSAFVNLLRRLAADAKSFQSFYDLVYYTAYRPLSAQVPCATKICRRQFLCRAFVANPSLAAICTENDWLNVQ